MRIAVVGELQRNAVVLLAQEGDDLLQVVAFGAAHAQLVALYLNLYLELLGLDVLGDALGDILLDTLLDDAHGADHPAGGVLGRAPFDGLEVDLALDEVRVEHVDDLAAHEVARGEHGDGLGSLVEIDLRSGILEVITLLETLLGVVEGVLDLLHVGLGDDVEAVVLGHDLPFASLTWELIGC